MDSSIIYQKGISEDIPLFLSFFKASIPLLFPEYSPNSVRYIVDVDYGPEWLTEKLKKGSKRVYLAFNKNKIVGYLFFSKPVVGVSYADWLAVDKSYQKQGVASHLLLLWEQEALLDGVHALQLWSIKNNIPFYKKRGFTCGGLFPQAWYGEDSYLIYKSLRTPEERNFLKG